MSREKRKEKCEKIIDSIWFLISSPQDQDHMRALLCFFLSLHFFMFSSHTRTPLMTIKRNLLDRCQISYSFSLSIFNLLQLFSGLQKINKNESFVFRIEGW